MRLFSIAVPLYRKGREVRIKPKTLTMKVREDQRRVLDKKGQYEWATNLWIISEQTGKIQFAHRWTIQGKKVFCYGIVLNGKLYVIPETSLSKL